MADVVQRAGADDEVRVDLMFRVGIKCSTDALYEALTQPVKLAGWWASQAVGTPDVGATIDLAFTGTNGLSFNVLDLKPCRLVNFECVAGPQAWRGTRLRFELQSQNEQVFVMLTHANLDRSDQDSYLYFSTKWPVYLLSLKDFVETGKGRPLPHDTKILHGD
jgi:uncharacterized protein YndB with AHSA1/START domain